MAGLLYGPLQITHQVMGALLSYDTYDNTK